LKTDTQATGVLAEEPGAPGIAAAVTVPLPLWFVVTVRVNVEEAPAPSWALGA
jgi:hypothetical protein